MTNPFKLLFNKVDPERKQTVNVGQIHATFDFYGELSLEKTFKGDARWSDLIDGAWITRAQERLDSFMKMSVEEGVIYIDSTRALPLHRLKDVHLKREPLNVTVSSRD